MLSGSIFATALSILLWTTLVLAAAPPTNATRTHELSCAGIVIEDQGVMNWPQSVNGGRRQERRNRVTNAERMRRGLPVEAPVHLYSQEKRALAAPPTASTAVRTYVLYNCNAGGDDFYRLYRDGRGTLEEQADTCAGHIDDDYAAASSKAFTYTSGFCYTGIDIPNANPVDCAASSAIFATYGV